MHQRVVLGLLLAVFLGFIAGCSKEKPQLSTLSFGTQLPAHA